MLFCFFLLFSPLWKFLEKEAAVAAGFLRIGSLNVRVKKTTEAFNNLIGGSIDNLYSVF